jgi:hypothetical protein
MVIFGYLADVALAQFCLAVVWIGCVQVTTRLVLATTVARVIVAWVIAVLFVVVVVAAAWFAIFRVVMAVLVGMLALFAMDVARLPAEYRGGLLFISPVAPVVLVPFVVLASASWGVVAFVAVPTVAIVAALSTMALVRHVRE